MIFRHGTRCAGVIAGKRNGRCRNGGGIAYNAQLAGKHKLKQEICAYVQLEMLTCSHAQIINYPNYRTSGILSKDFFSESVQAINHRRHSYAATKS